MKILLLLFKLKMAFSLKFKALKKFVKKYLTRKPKWKYHLVTDIGYKEPIRIIVLAQDARSGDYHIALHHNTDVKTNLQEIKFILGDLVKKYGIEYERQTFVDVPYGFNRDQVFESAWFKEDDLPKQERSRKNKINWR
jgi:hypothetical protein